MLQDMQEKNESKVNMYIYFVNYKHVFARMK